MKRTIAAQERRSRGYDGGVEDERADVLAWLHDVGTSASMSADEMVTLHWVARALYGMEHVGAAKRAKP